MRLSSYLITSTKEWVIKRNIDLDDSVHKKLYCFHLINYPKQSNHRKHEKCGFSLQSLHRRKEIFENALGCTPDYILLSV